MTDDQERLVAEALRAHAARTPLPEPEQVDATADPVNPAGAPPADRPADPPTVRTPGYPVIHPAVLPITPTVLPAAPPTGADRLEPAAGVAVGWVVLLAVLLGLASGAVVGLLTLL